MIKPTINQLSQNNKYNRYTLVMAAAKGARYVIERDNYNKLHPEYEQFRAMTAGITLPKKGEKEELKPVMEAIRMMHEGELFIKTPDEAAERTDVPEDASDER